MKNNCIKFLLIGICGIILSCNAQTKKDASVHKIVQDKTTIDTPIKKNAKKSILDSTETDSLTSSYLESDSSKSLSKTPPVIGLPFGSLVLISHKFPKADWVLLITLAVEAILKQDIK
ncbi:MAG: hypothetical protein JWQ79_2471 [Mucilaginibacter sp.]|nr:hypothetical protein [Mucilaginibacter sp.]